MTLKTLLRIPAFKYDARTLMKWLWNAWRGNQLQAILNATIGLLSVGVGLGQVWAVKHAIDVASRTVSGNIYWAVGWMAVLILSDFALTIAGTWVRNILGIKAQNRMQQRLLDRLLKAVWRGRNHHHSADILNRLEFDVSTVVTFLTETIPNTLSVLAMFLGAFFYLFSMDKVLAIIVIAIFPLFLAVSKIYVGRMRHLTRDVRDSDSKVQSVMQETIQHRMLIKTLESNEAMVERLENIQSELRYRVVKRTKFSVFSNVVINFGFAFGYLVAFLWAALRMSAHTLSFGGMTGSTNLNAHEGVKTALKKQFEAGKRVGAICAAPMVLASCGILDGKKATCSPGFERYFNASTTYTGELVQVDGNVTTGEGPAASLPYSYTLLSYFIGEDATKDLEKKMQFAHLMGR